MKTSGDKMREEVSKPAQKIEEKGKTQGNTNKPEEDRADYLRQDKREEKERDPN